MAVLEIILREEVGHVAIGTRWFNFCCLMMWAEALAELAADGAAGGFRVTAARRPE